MHPTTAVTLSEAAARLERSERRFRKVVDSLHDAVLIIDESYSFVDVNTAAEHLTGLSRDELVGHSLFDEALDIRDENGQRLSPDHPHVARVWAGADIQETILQFRHRDGSHRWGAVNETVVPAQAGDDRYVVVSCRDVTELLSSIDALSSSEERYRTLVDTAPIAIAALDGDGRVSFANEHLCELVGLASDEVIGARPADLVDPRHRPAFEQAYARRR